MCGPSLAGGHGIFTTQAVHTEPLPSVNCTSGFPTLVLVSQGVSVTEFCFGKLWYSVSVCFSDLGGSDLLSDLTALSDLIRVIDFSVCSPFYLLGHNSHQTGNWETSLFSFFFKYYSFLFFTSGSCWFAFYFLLFLFIFLMFFISRTIWITLLFTNISHSFQ